MLLDVVLPDGALEGTTISVQHPHTDAQFDVTVPAGVQPGQTFSVELPSAQTEPAPSVLDEAVRAKRLTPESADTLKSIMLRLYDYDDLDTWLDDHCEAFAEYESGAEQRLEWTVLHHEYVAMVEGCVAEELALLGASSAGLYALLADVVGDDERAQKFLSRLLSMGDYDHFCRSMRDDGGDGLRVCGYDVRALRGPEDGYTAGRVMVAPM